MLLQFDTVAMVEGFVVFTLGLLLLFIWSQNRGVRALSWWGAAYLAMGSSIAMLVGGGLSGQLWLNAIGWIVSIGAMSLMWNGARRFDGRPVLVARTLAGPAVAAAAYLVPGYFSSPNPPFILAASLSAAYLFAAAAEIWRGRLEPLVSRRPAIVLLVVLAAIFLLRIPFVVTAPIHAEAFTLSSGWIAFSVLAALLCETAIGFLVIAMAKERLELRHKIAARTDPLTGLGNRRAFLGMASRRLRRERRDAVPSAVLMFDFDHFKNVNDRFGHAVGDQVLRLFAMAVQESLRPTDIIGRIGGEEFAALLSVQNLDDALAAAERVRRAVELRANEVDGFPVGATVSVGVAIAEHGEEGVNDLLGRADEALYLAKSRGRNRVEVAAQRRQRLAA